MDFMNEDLVAHKPFRNLYLELSRWNKNNTFYSKLVIIHIIVMMMQVEKIIKLIQFQLNLL